MSIQRDLDGAEPVRPQPIERLAGTQEERRVARTWRLARATLACPACDAPVALTGGPQAPADPLACPVCSHGGAVRDFLSLATPTRPARVDINVVQRA